MWAGNLYHNLVLLLTQDEDMFIIFMTNIWHTIYVALFYITSLRFELSTMTELQIMECENYSARNSEQQLDISVAMTHILSKL